MLWPHLRLPNLLMPNPVLKKVQWQPRLLRRPKRLPPPLLQHPLQPLL